MYIQVYTSMVYKIHIYRRLLSGFGRRWGQVGTPATGRGPPPSPLPLSQKKRPRAFGAGALRAPWAPFASELLVLLMYFHRFHQFPQNYQSFLCISGPLFSFFAILVFQNPSFSSAKQRVFDFVKSHSQKAISVMVLGSLLVTFSEKELKTIHQHQHL